MSRRFIAPWKDAATKPAVYHCLNRVVDRRFVFEATEREHFRKFMRVYENFSGCRVLFYCIMSNHFHILLEERYKSAIVEIGVAARTMAAYIDLNPVRAGMVKDPAEYRFSHNVFFRYLHATRAGRIQRS